MKICKIYRNKICMNKRLDERGMMTVEASFIVPILLIIIMIPLFFNLFLIDMSVAKSETLRLADEAADVWKTNGKLVDGTYQSRQLLSRDRNFLRHNNRSQLTGQVRVRLNKRISSRLNGASLKESSAGISGDTVSVGATVCYTVPLLGSRRYTGISGWKFHCKSRAVLSNEEELLRKEIAKRKITRKNK